MVRYVSDDIGVMYLGQLVESSDSEEIYKNPLHPYTKALLAAMHGVSGKDAPSGLAGRAVGQWLAERQTAVLVKALAAVRARA